MGCLFSKSQSSLAWESPDSVENRSVLNSLKFSINRKRVGSPTKASFIKGHSPKGKHTSIDVLGGTLMASELYTISDEKNREENDDTAEIFLDSDLDEPPDETFTLYQLRQFIENNDLNIKTTGRSKSDVLRDIRREWDGEEKTLLNQPVKQVKHRYHPHIYLYLFITSQFVHICVIHYKCSCMMLKVLLGIICLMIRIRYSFTKAGMLITLIPTHIHTHTHL